jgi:hypothetical protein
MGPVRLRVPAVTMGTGTETIVTPPRRLDLRLHQSPPSCAPENSDPDDSLKQETRRGPARKEGLANSQTDQARHCDKNKKGSMAQSPLISKTKSE